MSDRTENKKTNREPTEAPAGRHDAPPEYTNYPEPDADSLKEGEAEALREAELQPGQGKDDARKKDAGGKRRE